MHFDRREIGADFPTAAKNRGFGAHGKTAGKGSRGSERSRTDDLSLHPSSQFAVADPASRVYPGFFPFLYYSLVLPKTITDGAIKSGKHFPQHILGFEFDQISYLMLLCTAFLVLVFINGAFKYYINTFKGRLGERMLRRFRYQLYQRMLLFPLFLFSQNSSAQIIPMITAECDSLGGSLPKLLIPRSSRAGSC